MTLQNLRSPFFLRRQHHDHRPALKIGFLLDLRVFDEVGSNPFEHDEAQFLVSHFTAAEPEGYLGLVSFREETYQVAEFYLIVPIVRPWANLHFLDLHLPLLFLRFLVAPPLLEDELPEIHQAADRRFCIRRNFHQIQLTRFGFRQCLCNRHDTQLLTILINQPHDRYGNLVIETGALFTRYALGIFSLDTLFLRNNATATRDVVFQAGDELIELHHTQIDAFTRTHGNGLRFDFFVPDYDQPGDSL